MYDRKPSKIRRFKKTKKNNKVYYVFKNFIFGYFNCHVYDEPFVYFNLFISLRDFLKFLLIPLFIIFIVLYSIPL